jgi:hypothetical protein
MAKLIRDAEGSAGTGACSAAAKARSQPHYGSAHTACRPA